MSDSQVRDAIRNSQMEHIDQKTWDYVVIGGGITGAQIFRTLSQTGKRVLLVDAGDFASGTSSQSGMLIWGGLIYLKKGHVLSVADFSRAREELLANDGSHVTSLPVSYVTNKKNLVIFMGFIFYWLLGGCRRRFPRLVRTFPELSIFEDRNKLAYLVEEAMLKGSDARYVLDMIFSAITPDSLAINYLPLVKGQFNRSDFTWSLDLRDRILDRSVKITASHVINCSGPSTESVNNLLQIHNTSHKHVWSKGVYLRLKKPPELESMLVIDLKKENDVITFCPAGATALWGPTETKIKTLQEGFSVEASDIQWLAEKYFACFGHKISRDQVLSVRAGVRPLCVSAEYSSSENTLNISRHSKILSIDNMNTTTIYGGKFTGSSETAIKFCKSQKENLISKQKYFEKAQSGSVTPASALKNEACWFLEDYLRRRTDINQTIHNGGFGPNFESKDFILSIAQALFPDDLKSAESDFNKYLSTQQQIDQILKETLNE